MHRSVSLEGWPGPRSTGPSVALVTAQDYQGACIVQVPIERGWT